MARYRYLSPIYELHPLRRTLFEPIPETVPKYLGYKPDADGTSRRTHGAHQPAKTVPFQRLYDASAQSVYLRHSQRPYNRGL